MVTTPRRKEGREGKGRKKQRARGKKRKETGLKTAMGQNAEGYMV
jgi:hypothetical protein